MTDMIDVLELLKSQHDEIEDLITEIEAGGEDRDELFADLADKLAAHAQVEEKIFYPAAMNAQTSELLHEAVEDHLAMKRVLAEMLDLDVDDDRDDFDAKLATLKELVVQHARTEEEGKLFPIVRKTMSSDESAALGNEVLAMFEEVIADEPRRNVQSETAEAAHLPSV